MNNLGALILSVGPFIVQVVLLSLQIYAYRRTNHYSLVLLAVGTTTGIVTFGLGRILASELLSARVRAVMFDAIFIVYTAYMVLAIWGAVALFNSYCRLTDANRLLAAKTE